MNEFNVDTMLGMPDFVIAELITNHIEIICRAQEMTVLMRHHHGD